MRKCMAVTVLNKTPGTYQLAFHLSMPVLIILLLCQVAGVYFCGSYNCAVGISRRIALNAMLMSSH